jgi:drug/metabolite transporter (DMT)-like permease
LTQGWQALGWDLIPTWHSFRLPISMADKYHSHLWPGVPLALGAAAAFGVSTPLAKSLLGSIDPWIMAGLLYLGSGFGLSVLIAIRMLTGSTPGEAKLTRGDLPWLAGTILFGGVLGPVLLLFGLNLTDAASASLLLNLEAVFTLLLAWIAFREHVDKRLFIGAVAIVAGAMLLSWQGDIGKFSWGAILIALACLSWAIDNNLTRKISALDPFVLAAIKGLAAGSVNTSLALSSGTHWPAFINLAGAMSLGFVSYGLGLVLFIFALRYLGTARTGAYYGTAPFIGAILAAIILGTPLTAIILIAGLFMAFGAWLHLAERHEHEHMHAEMEHDHSHVHDAHHQHDHSGEVNEPHSHLHRHKPLQHKHLHYPDLHHRHGHN